MRWICLECKILGVTGIIYFLTHTFWKSDILKYSCVLANSGFDNSGQEVLAEVTVSYIHLIPTYACEAGPHAGVRASTRENPPALYPIISSNMGLENGERSMELMRRGKMHLVMGDN